MSLLDLCLLATGALKIADFDNFVSPHQPRHITNLVGQPRSNERVENAVNQTTARDEGRDVTSSEHMSAQRSPSYLDVAYWIGCRLEMRTSVNNSAGLWKANGGGRGSKERQRSSLNRHLAAKFISVRA
jgi:hypothetical protein